MKPRTRAEEDAKLARRWGVLPRAIRSWRKQGAPLKDPKAMRSWLSCRKHLAPATQSILEACRRKEAESVASGLVEGEGKTGVAAALRRLEEAEGVAYRHFHAAVRTGDAVAIKATRESWLRLAESLRRFDAAVEAERRESGEAIPRKEAEMVIGEFVWWWRIAIDRSCDRAAAILATVSSPDRYDFLRNWTHDACFNAIAAVKAARYSGKPLPPWLAQSIHRGIDGLYKDAEKHTADRASALEFALELAAKHGIQFCVPGFRKNEVNHEKKSEQESVATPKEGEDSTGGHAA